MMRALLFAFAAACALYPLTAPAAETVTIVADHWCPYNCEPGSERPGFMIEIAQKAFARYDITVKYNVMPWSRAIDQTRKGEYTAIVGASRSDAPDFVFPAIAQGWMQNKFYVKTGSSWRFEGMDSLGKISLGVVADYAYGDMLDAYVKAKKSDLKYVQPISGDDALAINVKKLMAGRIGALVEDKHVMNYHLARNSLTWKISEVGDVPSSKQSDLFIAFSPENPNAKRYADILAKETKAMRASGELKKILAAYQVEDWQK